MDATWNSTTFINTLNAPVWNSDPTRIPNTGPSLGNIAYDKYNNQLFCTNFEDGRIYRIQIVPSGTTVTGNISEVFDPIGTTDITAGYAPLGDRVWGIGVTRDPVTNTVRVYYGVWVEHTTSANPSAPNRIGRVDLNPGGSINTVSNNNSLISMPDYGSANYSNPVSDIEFSLDNRRMIIAERPMWGDGQTGSHDARVMNTKIDLWVTGCRICLNIRSGSVLDRQTAPEGWIMNT
jgi:hypothetical protein